MTNKSKEIIFLVLISIIILGLIFVLSGLGDIKQEISNISLNLELSDKNPDDKENQEKEVNEGNINTDQENISTMIVFTSLSSPMLTPQTEHTVIIDKVSRSEDGSVIVGFNVLTNEAEAFSAFDTRNTFELVNLDSANQGPQDIQGSLESIPPKSSIEGEVMFKIPEDQQDFILQINTVNDIIFYEFDFSEGTYEEVLLG